MARPNRSEFLANDELAALTRTAAAWKQPSRIQGKRASRAKARRPLILGIVLFALSLALFLILT